MGAFVACARATPRIAVCSAQSRAGAGVGGCGALKLQCRPGINPLSLWGLLQFLAGPEELRWPKVSLTPTIVRISVLKDPPL